MEYLRDWSTRDRGLAEGLLTYEASLGPHGFPWREVLDDDSDGWYKVEVRHDNAQAAIDLWRRHNGDPEPGTRLFVVDTRLTPDDDN